MCGALRLMSCTYILAVLELETEKEAAGEPQQNGDLKVDSQTQMTPFEINLKEKRFITALRKRYQVSKLNTFI